MFIVHSFFYVTIHAPWWAISMNLWTFESNAFVSVCVCVSAKNIEKCFKQGRKGIYGRHSQRKTIIIILGCFCTWWRFLAPLFQLLPIIGFVAPPLSKSHVVGNKVRRGNLECEVTWNAYPQTRTDSEKLCGILYEGKLLHLLTLGCRDLGSSSFLLYLRGGVWQAIPKSLFSYYPGDT